MTTAIAEIDTETEIVLTTEQFDIAKHDAMVTLLNTVTGDHRTFWIRTVREAKKYGRMGGRRLVYLLNGPDRSLDGDWRPFANVVDGKISPRIPSSPGCFKSRPVTRSVASNT